MIYVVSDLHGQWQPFNDGLKEIGFKDDDRLYVIGDAIDRGYDGIKLLSTIKDAPNMDLLIGNHELLMLSSVDFKGSTKCDGKNADLWTEYNGGDATYDEYIRLPKQTRVELLKWLRERYLITQLIVNSKKYILSHTYYHPEYVDVPYKDTPYDIAWSITWDSLFRDDTYPADIYNKFPDITFITGHVPVQYIYSKINRSDSVLKESPSSYKLNNLINIDGGLSWGHAGVFNAAIFLRLDDLKEFVIPLDHTGYEDFAII